MNPLPPDTLSARRIGVPAMFTDSRYEQLLILTFGADLEFYERVLRRHFGHYRNQIVLADGKHLDRTISAGVESLKQLNRSWLAGPIRTLHTAHAKAILLAGPEAGLLLVGSGNLNSSGYAGPGECFTPYRWSPDQPDDLTAFTTLRDLTDGLDRRGCLDTITSQRLAVFWSAYDWWHAAPAVDGPVRHNLEIPLGDQFVAAVGDEHVQRLTVLAPFHDPHCAALNRLAERLRPQDLRVLVQPGHCSIDPHQLSTVLSAHNGQAYAVTTADDHDSYLHAKIITAVTEQRAICLTGSANSSMVALWSPYPNANIELGNLTSGTPDAFDHLFDPGVVRISGPVDTDALGVSIRDDDGDPADHAIRMQELCWTAPVISGVVCTVVTEPADIIIEIDGRPAAAIVELEPRSNGSTHFTGRLTEDTDIETVEHVATVTVRIGHHSTTATVPYQVERLTEQDARRVDADRLRHAAQLELDDPDLEQALAALEEILICDNVTRWSHQRPDAGNSPDIDAATINWADIDWNAVRRHPTFAGYGGPNGIGAAAGSDLAAYFEGLTQIVRELTEPPPSAGHRAPPTPEPDDNDDERETDDVSAGIEGVDIDDAADNLGHEDTDVTPAKHQSAVARNRRLIRNFVRRNLRALENPAFRQGAGPGVTILNIIILNWICWLAATKDKAPPADLIEERLRLWRLLWGDDNTTPYLDDLDEDLQLLTLEQFDDQRFEAVAVASMTDILTRALTDSDSRLLQLRGILRHAVSHPSWQVTATHLTQAAWVINSRPITTEAWNAGDIATTLWNASCRTLGEKDLRHTLASTLNVDQRVVELRDQDVIVDQTRTPRRVREAFVAIDELRPDITERTFAAWQSAEQRKHYRIRWNDGVAQYDTTTHTGWIYHNHNDMRTDLKKIDATHPPWRIQLDMLIQTARTGEPHNRLTNTVLA